MKKLIALLLLLCTFALFFTSCTGESAIAKPEDTNLEFWLLESPYNKNWTVLPDSFWMDDYLGKSYLAQGYDPIINENGKLSAPKQCVIYHTGNYPLIDIGVKRITSIYITDPQIYVFGLTINSTRKEIDEVMTKNGFEVRYMGVDTAITYQNETYRIVFYSNNEYYKDSIQINLRNRTSSAEIILKYLYELQKFFEGKK